MASEKRKLFSGEEQKLVLLDQNLLEVHGGLVEPDAASHPAEHTTTFGQWKLVLGSSSVGELVTASMTRNGSETYSFERTGDPEWSANGSQTLFPNAQFYNLVHMATREGLQWSERQPTRTA